MKSFLVFAVTIILIGISLLHFYWAFGGKWGIEAAIPKKHRASFFNQENSIFTISATLIVAVGLILFSIIVASNHFDFSPFLDPYYSVLGTKIIATIFLLRAIGDFNMFGIFKKSGDDVFTKSDTKIFIPICLFMGGSLSLVLLL